VPNVVKIREELYEQRFEKKKH